MLYERLLKALREVKANLESIVLQGQFDDLATYKFFAGQIKSLGNAIEICKTTFKEYEDEESN